MVSVTNALSPYDIREGRIVEWEGSRVRRGVVTVSFVSGDYTGGGVSISGLLAGNLNLGTILATDVMRVSDGIASYIWQYRSDQKLHAFNIVSGATTLTEVASGQIQLSGQTVTMEVIGT
jgi:hypothetical protein